MVIFLALAVGIGLAGYSFLKEEQQARISETRNQLAFATRLKAAQIERWRMERIGDGRLITENGLIAPAVSRLFSHPDDPAIRDEIVRWMHAFRSDYGYLSVLLLDVHSQIHIAVPEIPLEIPTVEIEEARKTGSPFLSDLRQTGSTDPCMNMDLIAPIFADAAKSVLLGYILLQIDPTDYLFPLIESWPMLSTTEKTLIVRAEGNDVTVLNELNRRDISDERHPSNDHARKMFVNNLLRGDQDFIEGLDSNGKPVFAIARTIPNTKWILITTTDKEEVLRPLQEQSFALAGLLVFLMLAGGLTTGMIWNRQRARIYRRMYRVEIERQALVTHFDYLTRYANDIIILSDMDLSILEANERATTAYGYSREELLAMNMRDFRTPEERDLLNEQLAQCKSTTSILYETVHQRKDGSRFPVEVSLQMLKTPSGMYLQGILRDISERKRAEAALRESEEKHRNLFETMVEGVLYQGRDSRIVDANPAALRILGLTLEQITDRTCMHPFWRAIREDGTSYPGEEHPSMIALRTGSAVLNMVMGVYNSEQDEYRWIKINAVPQFRTGESAPYQVYATFQDITEQKREENIQSARLHLLQYSVDHTIEELLLETLAEAERITDSPVAFYHCLKADQATVDLQVWSRSTTERFCFVDNLNRHYSLSKAGVWVDCVREHRPIIHNDLVSLKHLEGLPHGHVPINRMLTVPIVRGSLIVAILGVGNKSVDYKDWEISAVARLADLAWDVVERKRMEEALRQSEERYRTVVESVYDCVWEVNDRTRYTYMSPRVREMLGYEPEEVIGRTPFELMPQEETTRLIPFFKNISSSQQSFKGAEVTFRRRDGSLVVFESCGAPVRAPDGAVMGYRGIDRDITERKRMEQERAHVEAQLRQAQKMEALGTLAGGIAHDFNNILSAILGYTEMALFKMPDGEDNLKKYLNNVLTAGNRAKELVRQIIAFSRQKEKAYAPIEIAHIVKEVLKLLRATLPSTIDIRHTISLFRQSMIMADPTEIHQVLMNLCTNAAHAMRGSGGILEVGLSEAAFVEGDRLPHQDLRPGEYLKLHVSDTGHGMTAEVLRQIFNPFFTTKPIGQGTGMGLSVAHGIMKSCDGAITVESTPGEGSTFSLYFPKIIPDSLVSGETSQEVLTGKGRILFVDDESTLAELGQELIQHLGYSVTSRTGSREALFTFQSMPYGFDLLISDYTMPDMTGLELAKEVRRIRPGMPVIICSGYNEEVNENTISMHNIQGFIQKPLERLTLGRAIKTILQDTRSKP